jgi:putative FmdB family regulatory protein
MPTYEYACRDCGHQFDIVQAFSDQSLTECPECKGSLKKVFGNVGIAFKGSGFYKTDSRASSSTSSSSNGSSSSGSSSSGSSSSGSSDSGAKSAPASSGHSHSHGGSSHSH